ncbi:MAG: 30S ribosomal protein S16 [Bacteroidales bacterium]|nr:30S ribosomal protein S16 [Bacteroidales bacterium]
MAVKIRLQRHGKKGAPFYHIVIADARAARDGKFIEKLGTYNPMTNPATIELNIDSACKWLKNGAQPTDTVRNILSYKGVLLKRHLQIGVEKGAISQETADAKFAAWADEKAKKIEAKKNSLSSSKAEAAKAAFAKEVEVKEAKAALIAKKREEEAKAKAEAEAAANAEATEAPAEEAEAPVEE